MKNKYIFYVFVLLLSLPVITFPFIKGHIDSKNHEKRKFAERPSLSLATLPDFPEQFDNYFSDHLPYKNQLVMVNGIKNELLGSGATAIEYLTNTKAIRGKENWPLIKNIASKPE